MSLFKGMVVVVVSFLLRFGGMIAPPLFLCCVRHVNGAFVERIIPPSSLRLVRLSFTGKALPTSQYRQQQQQQQQPHDNYSSLFPSPDLFRQGRGQLLESASSEMEEDPTQSEEEWYPRDPAYTTPQLLVGLWSQIAQASTMAKGVGVSPHDDCWTISITSIMNADDGSVIMHMKTLYSLLLLIHLTKDSLLHGYSLLHFMLLATLASRKQ